MDAKHIHVWNLITYGLQNIPSVLPNKASVSTKQSPTEHNRASVYVCSSLYLFISQTCDVRLMIWTIYDRWWMTNDEWWMVDDGWWMMDQMGWLYDSLGCLFLIVPVKVSPFLALPQVTSFKSVWAVTPAYTFVSVADPKTRA